MQRQLAWQRQEKARRSQTASPAAQRSLKGGQMSLAIDISDGLYSNETENAHMMCPTEACGRCVHSCMCHRRGYPADVHRLAVQEARGAGPAAGAVLRAAGAAGRRPPGRALLVGPGLAAGCGVG